MTTKPKPRIQSTVYPPGYNPYSCTSAFLRWCQIIGASRLYRGEIDWTAVKQAHGVA